jgi:hypothetical protein
MTVPTKRVTHILRLIELRHMLADEAEQPVDAADVEGAEYRLHCTRVVSALDKRVGDYTTSLSSEEQAYLIRHR